MTKTKIRIALLFSVIMGTLIIFTFLWFININQEEDLRAILNQYLMILCGFSLTAFLFFFMKFDIFTIDGELEKGSILVMSTVVLTITQLAFALTSYSYAELNFTTNVRTQASNIYIEISKKHDIRTLILDIQNDTTENGINFSDNTQITPQATSSHTTIYKILTSYRGIANEISYITLTDETNRIIVASDKKYVGTQISDNLLEYYSFPIRKYNINMHISKKYGASISLSILVELITVIAISVFFTIELMLFIINYWSNRIILSTEISYKKTCQAFQYIRPLAFIFYFSSYMAASFLPLMAQDLSEPFFGLSEEMLTTLPISMEILFSSVAIFFTSFLIERKGWKLPFLFGLCLVTIGTILSAYSYNILFFIISRSIIGLGYGFCWMTLRNICLLGRCDQEKSIGFSSLNAGIYTGINCGIVFGAILVEEVGYANVFLVSALFTVFCSIFVIRLENQVYTRPIQHVRKIFKSQSLSNQKGYSKGLSAKKRLQLVYLFLFVLLMIGPTTIASSFLAYFLPIYFIKIGYSIADVGRAQLLYGVFIIYVGPYLATLNNQKKWTYLYSIIIGGALLTFGLIGGFIPAILTVCALGLANSFGFVVQNNYFLKFKILQSFGESTSLSLLSFIKKIMEATGPIIFGAVLLFGIQGIAILGLIFIFFALGYIIFCGERVQLK